MLQYRALGMVALLTALGLLVVGGVGCSQSGSPAVAGGALVGDRAILHEPTGGEEGFFFRPPVAPDEAYYGVFDGTRASALQVVIQLIDSTGQPLGDSLVTFTDTPSDPGIDDAIRVDPAAEQYIVNWHTDRFPVADSEVYRVYVQRRSDGRQYGYADVQILASLGRSKSLVDETTYPLKDGRTLPIKFRIEAGCLPPPGRGMVVFESNQTGDYEIYIVPADGSAAPERLTYVDDESGYPSWSPDGTKIVFHQKDRSTGVFHLYVFDFVTGVPQPLGADPGVVGTYPAWSPSGEQIAYESGGVLYVVDASGSGSPAALVAGYEPSWSPEGLRVAYRDLSGGISIVSLTTPSDVRQIATFGSFPAYSNDGATIAFGQASSSAVWIVPSDGSGSPQLVPGTNTSSPFPADPHWSPDGSQLVCNRAGDIGVVDSATGAVVQNLTEGWTSVDAAPAWCWAE